MNRRCFPGLKRPALFDTDVQGTKADADPIVEGTCGEPSCNCHCKLLQYQGPRFKAVEAERDRLQALINTPELVDFAKAVHLEAVHQEQRWGTTDREGKTPYDWHWLVAHLAGRALEHHKEAERLSEMLAKMPRGIDVHHAFEQLVAHHREKAVHHTITAAAALAHWHASVLGKHTTMQPGSANAARAAAKAEGLAS